MPIPISEPETPPRPVSRANSKGSAAPGAAPGDSSPQRKLKTARNEHVKGLVTNLWRSREDGDFVFNVCGGTLRAHGCILSAASPVFKAMLSSGMSEGLSNSMSVEADPAELQAMLRFIYLGELDATGQQLPGVLELAHKYEVLNLIPPVCEAMVEQLTIDTAVSFVRVLRLLEAAGGPVMTPMAPQGTVERHSVEPKDGMEEPSCDGSTSSVQAWMTLPAESLPSVPPAARTTCTGLSQPVQPVEVTSKERPSLTESQVSFPGGDDGEASPIAKAFQAVGKKIASDPELLMATLRSL